MASRYTKLSALPENLYLEGAPMIIAAGALLKDNQSDSVLVQLKIRNLEPSALVACKVSLRAFDPSGAEVPGVESYPYLDLAVPCGGDFGSLNAIYLPDKTARSVSVSVTEAVFESGEVWRHPATEWKTLSEKHRPLETYLPDGETRKQYSCEVGGNALYIPEIVGSLFYCTCGAINLSSSRVCYGCGRQSAALLSALNPAELTKKKDARLEKEAAARKEQERIAEERRAEQVRLAEEQRQERERLANEKRVADGIRRKKIKRITVALSTVFIIGVAAAMLITQIVIPNIQYKAAETLLAERDYNSAIAAFTALGEYKDAPERVMDVPYIRAEDLLKDGDYKSAIEAFQSLGDYRDAPDRVREAQQLQYDQAGIFAEGGDYENAINLFENLGDFSDSAEKVKETEYKKAVCLLEDGDYDNAIADFEALGDYADSKELLNESQYRKAYDFLQKGNYEDAVSIFEKIVNYKDVSELLIRAEDGCYQEGLELINSGKYTEAFFIFQNKISDYKDSQQQVSNIFNTVYADAFNSYDEGDYFRAYNCFVKTKKDYPEIVSTIIEDYILCCQIKMTHFESGQVHRLNSIYDKFTELQDETLKKQMLSVPQIQTLFMLQGGWEGEYLHTGIVGTSAKSVSLLPGAIEYEIVYSDGKYYFATLSPYTNEYLPLYRLTDISSNSFTTVNEGSFGKGEIEIYTR